MFDFKFSIIIAAYNSQYYIEQTINSIISQSIGFEDNVEIIVVNDGSYDKTKEIVKEYVEKYPNNIRLINNSTNLGVSASRNLALNQAKGEFINFLDSDDYISKNTLDKVLKTFNNNSDINLISIPIYLFGLQKGEHILNYKFKEFDFNNDLNMDDSDINNGNNVAIVNLENYPQAIQLSASSSFFRAESIKNIRFDESMNSAEDAVFVNEILLKKPTFALISNLAYYYRKKDPTLSLLDSSSNSKEYYTLKFKNFYFKLIEDSINKYAHVLEFIQYTITYDLQWLLTIDSVNHILNNDEFNELYFNLIKCLSYIDDEVILNQRNINQSLKSHILLLKYHKYDYLNSKDFNNSLNSLKDYSSKSNFRLSNKEMNDFKEFIKEDPLQIDIYKVENNQIYISGYYTSFFDLDFDIVVFINDSEYIICDKLEYPQRDYYSLNCPYGYNHYFEVRIPLEKYIIRNNNWNDFSLSFRIISNGKNKVSNEKDSVNNDFIHENVNLDFDFTKSCKLSHISKYQLSDDYISIIEGNKIRFTKKSLFKLLKLEFKTLNEMFSKKQQGYRSGVVLRLLYFAFKIFKRKPIWIFMDRLDSADDNGIALYNYSKDIDDGIKKYYVLDKNSKDFIKFKKKVSKNNFNLLNRNKFNLLENKSIKHRLITLFADKIISSHPDNDIIYPFWGNFEYFAGILNSKIIFLQHGVTKDNISKWLYKADKDLSLIVTVSDKEKDSFIKLNYPYNYDSDIIKVLGFPRFDNLEDCSFTDLESPNDDLNNNTSQKLKEIIIMPSWRHNFNYMRKENIISSIFFKTYDSLLNNNDLIEFAKNKGYKLVFKPHPNIYKFIDQFNSHKNVEFDYTRTYNEIFNNASLVITDYSSIAFDFAYLKKPIIYYHYANDYHFNLDESYFNYEKMGFGEIVSNEEDIVDLIKKYINSDCKMKDKYVQRIDNFFKYNDKNNCKRVYDFIKRI